LSNPFFHISGTTKAGNPPPTPPWLGQGLRLDARSAQTHYAAAIALAKERKLDLAIEAYRKAALISPSCVRYHLALGQALHQSHRFREAAVSFGRVVEIWPENLAALLLLGVALHKQGRLDDAIAIYAHVLRLSPGSAEAMTNLGTAYQDKGDTEAATRCQRRAVELAPQMASVHNNLGVALLKGGRHHEALKCYEQVLRVDPRHAGAHFNIGFAFQELGSYELAEKYYKRAMELKPGSDTLRFYMGTLHLLQGNFRAGWREYEARWGSRHQRDSRRHFPQPQWKGEPLAGQTILLHAEQGFGDTMQFIRYVPLVAALGADVILEVQPRLKRLAEAIPGVRQVLAKGERLPDFQWQCPLLSLPLAFKTELESIPSSVPYLNASSTDQAAWGAKLRSPKFRIGLSWGGNPKHSQDAARSVPLMKLLELLRIPGAQFYSLQKGPPAKQLAELPEDISLINLDRAQHDFYDSAAIVANLDLVISVDTSVAHLAGALGRPLWVLLHHGSDWRWLLDRSDCPWYPTARLFRKKHGEAWKALVDRVRSELVRLVEEHAGRTAQCFNAPR
jgi:tetratricopeptide (TPR) repeat protein